MSSIAAIRLVQWSLLLNQYNYTIMLKPTKTHADANMSRLLCDDESDVSDVNTIYNIQVATLPVTAEELKYEIENNFILTQVKQCLQSGTWPEVTDQLQTYSLVEYIMKPQPQIEVTHIPSSKAKHQQAPTCDIVVGDMVQIRGFIGKIGKVGMWACKS